MTENKNTVETTEEIVQPTVEVSEKPVEEAKPDKNDPEYIRVCRLMRAIFTLCDLSGYHVEERITLKSKKSGRIFK